LLESNGFWPQNLQGIDFSLRTGDPQSGFRQRWAKICKIRPGWLRLLCRRNCYQKNQHPLSPYTPPTTIIFGLSCLGFLTSKDVCPWNLWGQTSSFTGYENNRKESKNPFCLNQWQNGFGT